VRCRVQHIFCHIQNVPCRTQQVFSGFRRC
jgi:hypothetical protein